MDTEGCFAQMLRLSGDGVPWREAALTPKVYAKKWLQSIVAIDFGEAAYVDVRCRKPGRNPDKR
jgi:hypothetical protein